MNKKEVIGHDSRGYDLHLGDCCRFKINNDSYIGVITYCEEEFSYCFEMDEDNFPEILMRKVDFGSIKKFTDIDDIVKNLK